MKLERNAAGELAYAEGSAPGEATESTSGGMVPMVDADGQARMVAGSEAAKARDDGWRDASQRELGAVSHENYLDKEYGDAPVRTFVEAGASGLTFGLSDLALQGLGADPEGLRERRERNPIAAGLGETAGFLGGAAIAPEGMLGKLFGAGKLAEEGAAALGAGKLASKVLGGAAEGAVFGANRGIAHVALSADPATVEGALTEIGTSALFGAAAGGVAGGAGSLLADAAQAGRKFASEKLEQLAAHAAPAAPAGADAGAAAARTMAPAAEGEALQGVAKLDRAGIRAAEKVERVRVKDWAREEASKVFQEAKAFGAEAKATFIEAEAPDVAVRLGKSRKAIMRSLDDPKGFVESPFATAKALRVQESAIDETIKAGKLSERGLADAQGLLERNRALQERIRSVTDLYRSPASPMLDALQARTDELAGGGAAHGGMQKIGEHAVFGAAAGALAHLGVPFPIAALAGGKVASWAGEALSGGVKKLTAKLASGAGDVGARLNKALDAFATVGAKATRSAPVIATKTLEGIAFAPPERMPTRAAVPLKGLAKATRARIDELTSQVEPDPTRPGKLRLNAAAAADLHQRLAGLWATQPKFADALEAAAARRVTFLAEVAPKRPAQGAVTIGPDRWQPSDMESRKLARYVDAVEHPEHVIERLADGTLTPEDAKAMREVHPGLFAQVQTGLIDRLADLRKSLPYERRLTLSILFDVPVDESMSKPMIASLQSSFTQPTPTQQMPGAMQPMPGASVGNLKPSTPTAAQKTAG